MIPDFKTRQQQWSSPPVDDVGYLPSVDLLAWDDDALAEMVEQMETVRYQGWRNWENRWRSVLQLDRTRNKNVLDYGCGVGLEALQYAKLGNIVSVADISPSNLRLASRVIHLQGHKTLHEMLIQEDPPFLPMLHPEKQHIDSFDVIHCCGVLHHIPEPEPVVEQMAAWLRPGGELRLMVYSDEAWRIATRTEPPDDDVFNYEEFDKFWTHWDPIGGYADYYSRDRLQKRFGKWFHISECKPLTQHGEYLGAILVKL